MPRIPDPVASSVRAEPTLPDADLNLLKVFAAVYHHGQVTAAAQQLDMTPSAVSNAIARLRKHCGDKLFVRTQRGVVPTPYASKLSPIVLDALKTLQAALRKDQVFNPARSDMTFRVNVADVGQMLMIGSVLEKVRDEAPLLGIRTVDLPVTEVEAALMRGDVHLAVGHLVSMGKSLFRRKLVSDEFVCIVSQSNQRLRKRLSLDDFLDATHIRYSPVAVSLSRINVEIDQLFRKHGRRQRIALEAAHAFGLSSIVATSDYVLTVPSRLAAHYARLNPIVIHPLPLNLPTFDISLYWHERDHRDPAHQWFRNNFVQVVKAAK